jgi:dihydrofolate reductase
VFLKRIRTVVMGRGTYDFIAGEPSPWAYGDQRVLVVSSRPIGRSREKSAASRWM